MANVKISELTAKPTDAASTDEFPANSGGTTYKITTAQVTAGLTYASEAQARAGTAEDVVMDPLQVANAIDELAGDVVGPASATDSAVALYDGTTGKQLKDGPTIAAGGSLGLLRADGDGSNLTGLSATDQIARDGVATNAAMIAIANDLTSLGLTGNIGNRFLVDDFRSDSLSIKTGAYYDAVNDWYSSTDSSVQVLTHLDGADAATTATEETGKTLTFSGNAQLDTAQKKFGTASLLLDGTGDYVSISDTAGLLGTSDFTIECFVYISSSVSNKAIIGCRSNALGNDQWTLFVGSTAQTLSFHTSSTAMISNAGSIPTAAWVHVAAVRSSGTTTLYIGGSSVGSSADSNNYNGGSVIYIGKDGNLGSFSPFLGWIDEVRVCNTAKYTGNFTPPSSQFDIDSNMVLEPTAATIPSGAQDVLGYFVYDPVDSVTLGTDLTGSFSIDGGSTDASATITSLGSLGSTGKVLFRAEADVSGQSGTSLSYTLTTANNKNLRYTDCVGLIPLY